MSENKKEIISKIQSLSGKYSPYMIFSDWVQCSAIALQNDCYMLHNEVWKSREEQYKTIMCKYTPKERQEFIRMLALLTDSFEESMSDILGEIYMESGCGSKQTGQFFTPFHISKLTADLAMQDDISEDNPLVINEPSVGGGGMIIAMAAVLKDRGINYQRCMKVIAQDLDWRSVYMAYLQFTLLGINAEVVQGNTLTEPYIPGHYDEARIFRTPMRMGVLL